MRAATLSLPRCARDDLLAVGARVQAYARLRVASDATPPENLRLAARAGALAARLDRALAFFEPELLALPAGASQHTLAEEPALAPYRSELEALAARAEHVLSAETEAALAALGEALNAPAQIHNQIHATIPYEEVEDEEGRPVRVGLARYYFVLAHELGHAVHFFLADSAQLPANGSPGAERIVLFIEVPSRVNELLLVAHLLAHESDPRRRAAINLRLLDNLLHSLRTTMLGAHLERRLHQAAESGEPITLPAIMAMEGEIFAGFFGDSLAIDDDVRLYWA
jgi:oligoendopeptidase F